MIPSTLLEWWIPSILILSSLPIVCPLRFDPVTPQAGLNAPIYPDSRIYASWTKESGDPNTITIMIWWPTDALTYFASNVDINTGTVVGSVGKLDAPASYNLAVFVSGTAIGTSPLFTVVPSPAAPPSPTQNSETTTKAPTTSTPPPTTTSATTEITQSSSTPTTGSTSLNTQTFTSPSNTAFVTFTPSSTGSGTQTSSTGGVTSPDQNSQATSTPKKTPIGAIAGGAVGGAVILAAICVILFILLRRRKRVSDSTSSDALADEVFNQPIQTGAKPFEKRGRLEAVIREREEAQRQQDLLQADLRNQRASHLQQYDGPTQREALLMQQNQLLAERILALETQQRDIEGRLGEESPPDYATAQLRPVSRLP